MYFEIDKEGFPTGIAEFWQTMSYRKTAFMGCILTSVKLSRKYEVLNFKIGIL